MIYEKYFKRDLLPGGKGDKAKDSDFDPTEIKMGNKVELEHTDEKEVAKEITHDHLSEDPHYYSKLKNAGLADELKGDSFEDDLSEIIDVQVNQDNTDEYMKGLSNGLILAKSLWTGEEPQFLESYRPFFEFTAYDFRDRKNQVIKKTVADRKSIKGNIESTSIVLVDFDATTGETTWLSEPTYKLSNTELDTQGKEKGPTTAYTVQVQFQDYREWFSSEADPRAEVAWKKLPSREFRDFLKVADVKVHCSCPAFNYWGMRYQLTRANSAIHPQTIPDPVRSKQTGMPRPSACKHVIQVLARMINKPDEVLKQIKQKI